MSSSKSPQEMTNDELVEELIAAARGWGTSHREIICNEVLQRMVRTTPMPILDKFLQDMRIMRDELEKEIQDVK